LNEPTGWSSGIKWRKGEREGTSEQETGIGCIEINIVNRTCFGTYIRYAILIRSWTRRNDSHDQTANRVVRFVVSMFVILWKRLF
jgi:hypothetical protein